MSNLEISTTNALLGADLVQSLNTSPSCSTFLPEEDASTCPLLPNTPSPPPPMNFNDPLTPNILNDDCVQSVNPNDARAAEEESSSCSGSSGCIDGQVVAGTTTVFNPNVYQHLGKNGEVIPQSETQLHAHLNLPDSKDVPSFVYWNWKLIRQCSFLFFVAGVVAMAAMVVSMIYNLPKTCNPKTVWYEGSVFYEIHPARFPDSNSDGIGDLRGLQYRTEYLQQLGVIGIRLNSIFPSQKEPNHFRNVTTLLAIDEVLGTADDLKNLVRSFHDHNLSLILDLPVYPFINKLEPVKVVIEESTKHPMIMDEGTLRVARASNDKNTVVQALQLWMKCGIDGFYIKGLEYLNNDPLLLDNIKAWKNLIGSDRILMVNEELLDKVNDSVAEQIVKHVDLVDIFIDVTNGTKQIAEQVKRTMKGVLKPGNGAYIQWSIGGVSDRQPNNPYELTKNGALAATIMSLMLPGSPNVYHGDGDNEESSRHHFSEPIDSKHMHHLSAIAWNTVPQIDEHGFNGSHRMKADDYDTIARMIALRDMSPSIYKDIIRKKDKMEPNTAAWYHENNSILILMRWYPRRNTFASISNFGSTNISLDLTSHFYSGQIMIGGKPNEKVYFDHFEIGPTQTIVVKLDK